MNDILKNP